MPRLLASERTAEQAAVKEQELLRAGYEAERLRNTV